ncbi:E3 ubiquitin-protein ligase ATL4-like isoform X2 [Salvia miltiorrhiza]|uniref:E3 ubiquitin-protein ligase ATL4-like isoform X2 n=1 Tax=Salvia miltiorrhiza TaxID=226208 RepID=UPI0025AB7D7C|nr:E3 ubiquitin-protein ligase ATL4-like isoform X2 [Salvia miltiorrhiza]
MSGSFRNSRQPESWPSGQEYWIYLPVNRSGLLPPIRSLNPRAGTRNPWLLVEESFIGRHDHGLASFPPAHAHAHPSVPLRLMEDSYPAPLESPPWNRRSEESKLSPEEQKQAVNKLRKQLYSPHIYNIIRRLGNKSSNDEEGKRCAVCLEDFETKQFVTITPCNHMFHEECIVPWVKSQGKCPVCRFLIVQPERGLLF